MFILPAAAGGAGTRMSTGLAVAGRGRRGGQSGHCLALQLAGEQLLTATAAGQVDNCRLPQLAEGELSVSAAGRLIG